jgi:hypothetical protein
MLVMWDTMGVMRVRTNTQVHVDDAMSTVCRASKQRSGPLSTQHGVDLVRCMSTTAHKV